MDEARVSHGAKQREAAPQSAKAYCVSLLACLLGATLLATGAVTAPFAFALSLFSLEPVVFCTPSLSSLVPFSLSLRVASPRWQDAPSPMTLPAAAPPFSRRVQISYQRVTEAVPIALAAPTLPFFLWRGLVLGGAGTTGGRGCGLWVLVSLAAWLAD